MTLIRKPAVAGMFYPADKKELETLLKYFFESAEIERAYEKVCGIIAPHAGYVYSGQTAAYAYKTIVNKDVRDVVVISPSHREYFRGSSIFDGEYYSTPLGKIRLNREMAEEIVRNSETVFAGEVGHRSEHALEVQLPFLQFALGKFTLTPIVMGDQSQTFVDDLATALSKAVDEKTLIVASSDLSHYYPKETAQKLDAVVVNDVNNYDFDSLSRHLENNYCEACGGGPMITMMKALANKGCKHSAVLKHSDSGDVSGDNRQVVGYLSAVVYS